MRISIFITTKVSKSSKIKHVTFSTLSRLIFYIFSRNKLRSAELNSLFEIHCFSVEINKKEFENNTKNVMLNRFLELSNQFYKKFAKLTFYCYIKVWCNKTKLITKRERFRCVRQDFKDWSRRISFNSTKKLSSQSIKKKIKEKFNIVINMLMIRDVFATLMQRIKNS